MTEPDPDFFRIDRRQMRAAFERAATTYDQVAVLQRVIGERLIERLDLVRLTPENILDAGAGTGSMSETLARHYPGARVIAVDLSTAMLQVARRRSSWLDRWRGRRIFVCADVERLPVADARVDLVISNLTLQWCNDVDRAFAAFRRVLRPGGLLMFTTFGPDTLKELRASWSRADAYNHVNAFADMHDIGDALVRAGFSGPVMDREDMHLTYRDVASLMHDLKALGAHNMTWGRPRGLTTPRRLARMVEAYESYRTDECVPATYEVLYGHCWAETGTGVKPDRSDEIRVPLSGIARPGKPR